MASVGHDCREFQQADFTGGETGRWICPLFYVNFPEGIGGASSEFSAVSECDWSELQY